jgi:hypothetical protein
MKFVIIETPALGDLASVLLYIRWALRDSINRDEAPLPALGEVVGHEAKADKAVFYLDRGWTEPMYAALAHYLKIGLPIERRWLEDHREVSADEAKALAGLRVMQEDRIREIGESVGKPVAWL